MSSGSCFVLRLTNAEKGAPMVLQKRRRKMRFKPHRGRMSAVFVSITCCLRGFPFLVSTTPKTPLRVLCMMAFDTLHVLRNSKSMPRHRLRVLAALLDFGACANAGLDNKKYCENEYVSTQQLLQDAGLGPLVDEYVSQLRKLENRRPSHGGDHRNFEEVRTYREAVARLSLDTIAAMVFGAEYSENVALRFYGDDELEILFRIVMQCQIIDDVLDYAKDVAAGLPSFLTASASWPQAIELTAQAARNYGNSRDLQQSGEMYPLRMAVFAVSVLAKQIIRIRHQQDRIRWAGHLPEDREGFRPI